MQYHTIGIALGISAAIVQLIAYAIYNKDLATPNAASWFLWAVGSLVEGLSYVEMTGDWVKNLLPISCCFACVGTFVYVAAKGKFGWPSLWEVFIILLDLGALWVWYHWRSATYANLWMQVTAIMSFIPVLRDVFYDSEKENRLSWYIWALAYAMLSAAVVCRYEKWEDLVYPVNFCFLHLGVAFLAGKRVLVVSEKMKIIL